ncbi:MAG TPA: HD-GYP domain-containing protein [Gaiellaceae bacterium]|nr:HD-GYP domain-containing protein [Gaiellaceae bacterium]
MSIQPKSARLTTRESLLVLWVWTLALAAAGMCAGLIAGGYQLHQPVALAVLALLAIVAEHQGISLTPNAEVSAASLVCVFTAVVLGPLSGAVVAAAGLLVDLPRRDVAQPVLRWSAWTSGRVIATATAGLTAAAVLSATSRGFWSLFGAVSAAFFAETAIDVASGSVIAVIKALGTLRELLRSFGAALALSLPLHISVVSILAYSYTSVSPWSVALFAVPAFAAQRLLLLYREQRETAQALGDANARLASANLSFATALVATLDARDRYTAGHSTAVAIYARDIASRMGRPSADQELVHLCGLVHDVGKIGLPAGLLEKPGALSLEERRQMEEHSAIGEAILRNVDDYGEIADIVRHHHERVDGEGYPDRLVGKQIPLLARIIAVADAYNAMTSDRPYRDAMPSRVARLRLAQAVDTQFDTAVVAAFEAILASSSEEYRLAREPEFVSYSHVSSDEAELATRAAAVVAALT